MYDNPLAYDTSLVFSLIFVMEPPATSPQSLGYD